MTISKKLRRNRGWIALVVLVALGGVAYALTRPAASGTAATTYTTGAATKGTLSVTVAGTGNLEVDGTTDIYPVASGKVASIKVAEGDKVAVGDVLFTLDADTLIEATLPDADTAEAATAKALAGYRQSQQGVAQASANVVKAKNNLSTLQGRAKEPSSTVTSADIAAAKAEVSSASAGLTSAKASATVSSLEYEQTKDAESDLSVKATASGIVYALNIEVGDAVAASSGGSSSGTSGSGGQGGTTTASTTSSAPVVLAPEQPLAVHLTVNEVDLPTLKIGQRADIAFDALPTLTATGKVYDIAKTGTNSSGVVTFDVWLSLDVADAGLRSGMSSAATIVTNVVKDALLVPNGAVKSDGNGGYYVQILDASGAPQKVVVETGEANATQTQILSGISEGDKVVTASSSAKLTNTGGGFMGMGGGGPRD
jgi:multidrug efflux pump subunit AcrA (membrane-fusion protein)